MLRLLLEVPELNYTQASRAAPMMRYNHFWTGSLTIIQMLCAITTPKKKAIAVEIKGVIDGNASIPMFVVMKGGKIANTKIGAMPKANLEAMLK